MEPNNERKTPAGEQNELFKKQVFSDETLRTADPDEEETGEQHFETLTFDKPAVLDERFAARKAERETAQPPQAKSAAPRPAAKPVKRQVPAAQKNKSVHGRKYTKYTRKANKYQLKADRNKYGWFGSPEKGAKYQFKADRYKYKAENANRKYTKNHDKAMELEIHLTCECQHPRENRRALLSRHVHIALLLADQRPRMKAEVFIPHQHPIGIELANKRTDIHALIMQNKTYDVKARNGIGVLELPRFVDKHAQNLFLHILIA